MSFFRHAGNYTLVGLVQWVVEYALWFVLSTWVMPVAPANVIGRIAGATLGFWLNGVHTFKAEHTEVSHRQLWRFLVMWVVTTIINTALVHQSDALWGLNTTRAIKPGLDFLTGAMGFFMSRHWVYHKASTRERLAER